MPVYTAWPTALDVEIKLKSAAYWPTDATKILLAQEQATVAVNAAKDAFEHFTGWRPFLADASATTWYFDSSEINGDLSFDGGFVTVTGVTIGGTLQTLNTNYTLEPRNAPNLGQPYTRLNLRTGGYGWGTGAYYGTAPNSIAVTGRRGYCTTIPGDAWQAVQEYASVILLASIENLQSIASISQDGFSKAFDVVGILTQKDIADRWGKNFYVTAGQYRRVIV